MYNLVTELNKNFVKDLAPYPGNIMLRERIINSYFVIISYIIYYQTPLGTPTTASYLVSNQRQKLL